ncbi:hypothetical protein L5G28_14135 [Gordonia sp. HY285]|uniref:hypothetical protein n=1 Tax=Gordonia liuliyuniae TaxID=2911517 RepID=UPI001F374A1C|nr:hypothetical protein [Gordonia liuliyuniae]MCF8611287.1 hypothetical protein [Gordonia liuliyuniae]
MIGESGDGVFGRIAKMFRRGGGAGRVLSPEDPDLVVVVRSDDDAVATSTVLESAEFESASPVVLRHLIAVPASAVASATASAALEGYVATERLDDDPPAQPPLVPVALSRVQRADARTVSQERSRVASLASRNGGVGLGWAVLDVLPDR